MGGDYEDARQTGVVLSAGDFIPYTVSKMDWVKLNATAKPLSTCRCVEEKEMQRRRQHLLHGGESVHGGRRGLRQ